MPLANDLLPDRYSCQGSVVQTIQGFDQPALAVGSRIIHILCSAVELTAGIVFGVAYYGVVEQFLDDFTWGLGRSYRTRSDRHRPDLSARLG